MRAIGRWWHCAVQMADEIISLIAMTSPGRKLHNLLETTTMKVCLHGRLPEHEYRMILQLRDRRLVSGVQFRVDRPYVGVDVDVRCTRIP